MSIHVGITTCLTRVSVQGVESLGGHFATLCQEFDFYEVKKYYFSKRKVKLVLVSKELNNFVVFAGLFRQIGDHSSKFCYFALFKTFHFKND